MTSEKILRKDKNQNIQVFVRLRPLNQRELTAKSLGAVEVSNNKEVVVRQSQQTSLTKKFLFDKAFGPYAKQVEVYQAVVSPLIEEVLAGYNCTVFAYGQTGTGKTHTMVGENTTDSGTTWQNDPLAGIIPRALSQLFDELRLSNTEYTVRVSYLELYNEELFDLLSTSEDNSKLRIYEDVTRKGSNIVNGLEEITVYNKNEVYKIMEQGQERKKVASTLMNAQSSRSHTVFTIVVHMKENSPEGEELVKIGKLNLVDLAGSENISKAGTDNPAKKERARECVNINQSLLTLGRVITALVERHPHIPYRESKLTRILQESLGGRTKTSIIATISPGHKDLEETMSTLEYAYRAKNIQNKPEVNQKMTKKAILKEYSEEIDRLKRDLTAARDKNGVYLANETFAEMTIKQEEQRKEIQDLLLQKRAMEEQKERMENVFGEISSRLQQRESELDETVKSLVSTKEQLNNTSHMLKTTKLHYEEQKHLVSRQRETEQKLSQQAKCLLNTAERATSHLYTLHDRVDTRRTIESRNLELTRSFREHSTSKRAEIESLVDMFTQHLSGVLEYLLTASEQHNTKAAQVHSENRSKMNEITALIDRTFNELKGITQETTEKLGRNTKEKRNNLHATLIEHCSSVEGLIDGFVRRIDDAVSRANNVASEGGESFGGFVEQWLTSCKSRITSLRNLEQSLMTYLRDWQTKNVEECNKRKQKHRARHGERRDVIRTSIEELECERKQMEESMKLQQREVEKERAGLEARLQQWAHRERAALEQKILEHSREQRACLEERLTQTTRHIEIQREKAEERISKYLSMQRELLAKCEEDEQLENAANTEYETTIQECVQYFGKYDNTFDLESSAVTIDMSAFCDNLKQVLEHINTKMMASIIQVQADVQDGAKQLVLNDKADTESFAQQTDLILTDIVHDTERIANEFVQRVEENNKTVTSNLNELTTKSITEQISSEHAHLATLNTQMKESQSVLTSFRENVSREVKCYGEMEGRFLLQEYAVYKPSGETPQRQEYSYPRTLAATSPHDRILARYRAGSIDNDDDCVLIENDMDSTEQPNSSTSVSDSASIESIDFIAPSPPLPITKCTSESDVYLRTKQKNGKENTERLTASSTKKPSRLPAPAAHKKPLIERNTESS